MNKISLPSPLHHLFCDYIFMIIFNLGVRRLRRRASDPKYPEMKALERLFNELQQTDAKQGNVLL